MKPGPLVCLALGACITVADGHAPAGITPPPLPAHATTAAALDDDPWSLLARLPPTIDAAAVLDRPGERLWSDPAGLAFRAALSGTGLFAQTERAWSGLAGALGYTGDQAATALLGRRVLIAWDGLIRDDGAGATGAAARADTRWVVIAQIDAETARSLRARLNAAPRRTLHGRVIYSVDAGRTAMAVIEDAGQTRVVFAPNAAASLLENLLAPPHLPPAPVPANPNTVMEKARAMLGRAETGWAALGVVRLPKSDTPAAVELRTADGAWTLRFAAPGEPRAKHAETGDTGSPVGVLTRIGSDALLAATFREGPRFTGTTIDLGLRFGMDTSRPDTAPPDPPAPPNPGPLHPGRGGVLILTESQRTSDRPPTLIAQLITHTRSDRGYAETIDRAISAMIGGPHPPEHRGAFPSAVRSHTIQTTSPAGPWPGPDARIAWCLAPDEGSMSGAVSMAIAPAGVDPVDQARQGREAWLHGLQEHDPNIITAGHARPRELARVLAQSDSTTARGLVNAVERIDWTVLVTDGLTRGEIRMRFALPGVRLGSP